MSLYQVWQLRSSGTLIMNFLPTAHVTGVASVMQSSHVIHVSYNDTCVRVQTCPKVIQTALMLAAILLMTGFLII